MIIVTVKIPTKHEHTHQFIEHMTELAQTVRKEKGCIVYNLYTDPATPQTLFMYEEWESMDALRAHISQPHMIAHKQKTADWLCGEVVLNTSEAAPASL